MIMPNEKNLSNSVIVTRVNGGYVITSKFSTHTCSASTHDLSNTFEKVYNEIDELSKKEKETVDKALSKLEEIVENLVKESTDADTDKH